MAFQIFWKIKFKSLRSSTDYTVNIYKDGALPTGYPLTLLGAASPFTTDENDSEDEFIPVRTQTGYLRIFDNGVAINTSNQEVAFNWHDIMPINDTDSPVTLSHDVTVDNVTTTIVDWYGFMQAQTFGGTLYGNPQERDFPVQCPLSVTAGTDADVTITSINTFAFLLKQIVDSIPSICRPTSFVIQGGEDAQRWLLKRIDWQNFIIGNDEELSARYNYYQCLEDMCRFWGWTARIMGNTMYLTSADDTGETNALTLTSAQLATMANGVEAGTISTMYSSISLSGDIFANINNDDSTIVGANKVDVQSDGNSIDNTIIKFAPTGVDKYMRNSTPSSAIIDGKTIYYYGTVSSFPTQQIPSTLLAGSVVADRGILSFISIDGVVSGDAVRILKSYAPNQTTTCVSFETVYEHCFYNGLTGTWHGIGGFQINGNVYQKVERVNDYSDSKGIGNKSMYMRFGIGKTRQTARWFNGFSWQASMVAFKVTVGNQDSLMQPFTEYSGGALYLTAIPVNNEKLEGKVFVDLCGSDDLDIVSGERAFFITDFEITFVKRQYIGYSEYKPVRLEEINQNANYLADNSSKSGIVANIDCAYASDNNMDAGYGVIINPDGSTMQSAIYNGSSNEYPEQHLASRVAQYWENPKRKIYAELDSNAAQNGGTLNKISAINPRNKVTMDGTILHPIAISHDWHDDVSRLTLLELIV